MDIGFGKYIYMLYWKHNIFFLVAIICEVCSGVNLGIYHLCFTCTTLLGHIEKN